MKRFCVLVVVLIVGGGVGVALANASTHASRTNVPEPRLGEWDTARGQGDDVRLRVERVKTETQTEIDTGTGKRVTTTREDYLRLTDIRFGADVRRSCPEAEFGDVRIGSDGEFKVNLRDYYGLEGRVVNPTTIDLELSGPRSSDRPSCTTVPWNLHPVGLRSRPPKPKQNR
jgi:hypothetical protein